MIRTHRAPTIELSTFGAFARDQLAIELTDAQAVFVSVAFDGVDPGDLEPDQRAIAAELFGPDVDYFPEECRTVVAWLKGARSGGTWLSALHSLYLALTVDLDLLAHGEVAFVRFIAPSKALARQSLRYVSGALAIPQLAGLVIGETTDSITIEREDGARVVFQCTAAAARGAETRGAWIVCAVLDEACLMRDPDTGMINDTVQYDGVRARILPGGRVIILSTAWAKVGLLWTLVEENHGQPSTCVAAVTPTLVMRPDEPSLRQAVETERKRDAANAAREFDCSVLDVDASQFFPSTVIENSIVKSTAKLRVEEYTSRAMGVDLGFAHDASAAVVVGVFGGQVKVLEAIEIKPTPGKPLKPSEVIGRFARLARTYRVSAVVADVHYRETLRESLEATDLRLTPVAEGPGGKASMHVRVRAGMSEGNVLLLDDPALIRQLREVQGRAVAGGGLSITSPRRKGGHGDLASAYVGAVWYALTKLVSTVRSDGDVMRDLMRADDEVYAERETHGWPAPDDDDDDYGITHWD
jgi:hypothetical protein